MDKAQVQKSPSTTAGKQNALVHNTRASANNSQLHDIPNNSPIFQTHNTSSNLTPSHFAHLQRTLGNRAVGRIIQAKLTVSKPDDKYEREADQVADKVMRMPNSATPGDEDPRAQNKSLSGQITPLVQRMPEKMADEKQPPVQAKPDEGTKQDEEAAGAKKPLIQRMTAASTQQDQQDKKKEQEQPGSSIHRKPEEDKAVQAKALSIPFPQVSRLSTNSVGAVNRSLQMPGSVSASEKRPDEGKPDLVQRKRARYQLHDDHDEEKKPVQPKSVHTPTPHVTPSIAANINALNHRGNPLPRATRAFFEPRFGVDFSQVRVHTDTHAAETAKSINAKAFTVGPNIAFGRDQYAPESHEGQKLLAHELTHTIQQGTDVQRSSNNDPLIQREEKEGSWLDNLTNPIEYLIKKATDFISNNAEKVPGFTMLTVIIGKNPLTGAAVDRSPGNILKGAIEMIPGGSVITEALNNHGVFDKISVWAAQQFNTLKAIGSNILQDIKNFVKNFSVTDLANLGAVWDKAKNIVTAPIAQIKAFAIGLKNDIVTFVKDAILKPIAAFAKANIPNGYDLLCAVMGKDPISGEPVKQSAENLIAPFMKLIGQQEVWENMKKADAIGRAWVWFQGALGTVKGFVQEIPALFMNTFRALDIADIVLIPRAFAKLIGVFGSFAGRFITWAGTAVWNLLEIIFDSLKPGLLGYIKKTGAALKSILKNPLPFVGNLVKAAIQGFKNFADNIGSHLKAGLIDWLTGSLSGVYIPKALSLPELGKFALSVLGITWAQIRGKIVKALGPTGETIMKGLETGFDIVVALVKGGPAAAWELIKEKLSDLKDTVVSGIIGFVTETVIKKAVPKLIAMFIPGAGFISAIISIYDTIMVFVEKISKIIQVVTAFIDSIVTIAAGNITAAANRVESILAGLLSLAISFLAGFAGLGKVTDKIKEVIEKIRGAIDKALDLIINTVVGKAKAWFAKLFGGKDKKEERTQEQKKTDLEKGIGEAQQLLENKKHSTEQVKKELPKIKSKYKITIFELVTDAKSESKETDHIHGEIHSDPVKYDGGKVEKETIALPDNLKVGIYIKFNEQIWKVSSIDLNRFVIISHITNINDIIKFKADIFVENFKNGIYPSPTDEEIKKFESIDPNWKNKRIGKPQKTGTPGHAELMDSIAEKYQKMPTVKFVYLDRQYRTIQIYADNKVTSQQRADIVVEHMNGRLDIIEVRSKSDNEAELIARNMEVRSQLPKSMQGGVKVEKIPGVKYPN